MTEPTRSGGDPPDSGRVFGDHVPPGGGDVRMRGFGRLTPVAEALAWIDREIASLASERVRTVEAIGRVLAEPVISPVAVPAFRRAMMDGFAVRAADTTSATEASPVTLQVVARLRPGRIADVTLAHETAAEITTGSPVPSEASSVIPVERVTVQGDTILVSQPWSEGKHVQAIGEDVAAGAVVMPRGRLVRAQDVAALVAIGVAEIAAVRRPRVRLIVTGQELIPPGGRPSAGRTIDCNSPMLSGLIDRDGGEVESIRYVPDDPTSLASALDIAERDQDVDFMLLMGGTSVGVEDHGPSIVARLGTLAIHGLALRPAKPVGLGRLPSGPVILLPGNPGSCLCAYELFAGRTIRRLGGRPGELPHPTVQGVISDPIVSPLGRFDFVPVICRPRQNTVTQSEETHRGHVSASNMTVSPCLGAGPSSVSRLADADGFVLVPAERDGVEAGQTVTVFLS